MAHSKFYSQKSHGFDSKKEERRYRELQLLEKAGKIHDLKRQVRFELIPSQKENGKLLERKVEYVADFTYYEGSEFVVEDVKSAYTRKLPAYILKRKLMLWVHGIRIHET